MLSLTALFRELKPSSRVEIRFTDSSLESPGSFEVDGIPKLWKKERGWISWKTRSGAWW
jgi:hypothetical protein